MNLTRDFQRITIFLTLIGALAGCATEDRNDVGELRKQLYELQKAQGLQASRIEELNNKILLLKDRVDTKISDGTPNSEEPPPPPLQQSGAPQLPSRSNMGPVPVNSSPVAATSDRVGTDDDTDEPRDVPAASPQAASEATTAGDESLQAISQGSSPGSGRIQKDYERAVADSNSGRIESLEKDVAVMMKDGKESPLTNNALFLLAEAFFNVNQYAKSAVQYEKLYKLYPDGNKAVAALYRLGLCYEKLGRKSEAKEAFQNVMTVYPGSREAIEAEKNLNRSGEKGT